MVIRLPEPKPEEAAEGANALVEALAVEQRIDLKNGRALLALRKATREDGVDHHVSIVVVIGLYITAAIVLAMFCTIALNKMLPTRLRYLDPEQVNDIYGFVLPLVSGFGAGLGKKYLKGSANDNARDGQER